MSTKLVKRRLLLQESTGEVDLNRKKHTNGKTNKNKKRKLAQEAALAEEQEVVDWHIRSMLRVDRVIRSRESNAKESNQRLQRDQQKISKQRKKASAVVLGNSRSVSSQMKLVPEPTFNKRKYKKEQEEKRLQEIAKLLKKRASKNSQSKKNK